jgi:hypothetical protein
MAYDVELAERVERVLKGKRNVVCKKMFGGLGFMVRGNMCVGIWQQSLVARVGAEDYLDALAEPFTEEFDITGKPLTGWVMVNPEGLETEAALAEWIGRAMAFVKTLPAK